MTPSEFVSIFREGLYVVLVLCSSVLIPGLCIGLIVAIFQAATSINEQTLSFLPRLLTTLLTLAFIGHWMVRMLMDFMINLVSRIPTIIG